MTDTLPVGEEWREHAACRGKPIGLFFPPDGAHPVKEARLTCEACPVRLPCLEYGLGLPKMSGGVWGGLTEVERDRLRTKARNPRLARRRNLPYDSRTLINRSDHGTHACYVAGCRCWKCRDGEADYSVARKRARRGIV